MYNHAAFLLRQLNDPLVTREQYMRYWREYHDIVREQKIVDEMIARRNARNNERFARMM